MGRRDMIGRTGPSTMVGAMTTPDAPHASATTGPSEAVAPMTSPPLVRPDPKAAAFFDLDNTVIQGASLFHLARGLY